MWVWEDLAAAGVVAVVAAVAEAEVVGGMAGDSTAGVLAKVVYRPSPQTAQGKPILAIGGMRPSRHSERGCRLAKRGWYSLQVGCLTLTKRRETVPEQASGSGPRGRYAGRSPGPQTGGVEH